MISIERPYAFFALLILIPAILFVFFRYKKLLSVFGGFHDFSHNDDLRRRLKKSFFFRTAFRAVAWTFAVFAYAGFTWGTENVPVQKSGNAVCLVFDVSYSMLARDTGFSDGNDVKNKLSRLKMSGLYAKTLLSKMDGTSISVVLSKGDGYLFVPLTEDYSSVYTLIDNLSPELMTFAGSSLGKGIKTAVNSFPQNLGQAPRIWFFTDGEETDSQLEEEIFVAAKSGIPVTIIGFGSEEGLEITAGGGQKVHSALQAEKISKIVEKVSSRADSLYHQKDSALVNFVRAEENGSAASLLKQLKSAEEKENSVFTYEIHPVRRHVFLMLLAVIFFVLSFVVAEFDIKKIREAFVKGKKQKKNNFSKKLSGLLIFSTAFIFISCGDGNRKAEILHGAWHWYHGNYRQATARFINTYDSLDDGNMAKSYALFGLASTYISLQEYDVALEKLNKIQDEQNEKSLPENFLSDVCYNKGMVFVLKSDFKAAAEEFKKAILLDQENLDAKINLELCLRQNVSEAKESAEELLQKNDSSSNLEKSVFELINQNEQEWWTNREHPPKDESVLDY